MSGRIINRAAGLEVQAEAAGRVVNLPPVNALEATLREITNGRELLKTYDERRNILEGLPELKIVYDDINEEVVITGKVPVAANVKNCEPGIWPDSSSSFPSKSTCYERIQ